MYEKRARKRVIIEGVDPEIDGGSFPVKKVAGDTVNVEADIYCDGHDKVYAQLLYKKKGDAQWMEKSMDYLVNDRWKGQFTVEAVGTYYYTFRGWIDHFRTWQDDIRKKSAAGTMTSTDLAIGVSMIERACQELSDEKVQKLKEWRIALKKETDIDKTLSLALSSELADLLLHYHFEETTTLYDKELPVEVNRKKASFSTWYEFFPRSACNRSGHHGTFKDCEGMLPELAQMGFDVIYFPPIHPIGITHRKGKNNNPASGPDDPGSPWAIGASEGGHKSIHPELGTMEDFQRFIQRASDHGLEVALDLTFQCSMDHPYLSQHPEWFIWRPDGTVQYAENPPKKYQDVVPFNFDTPHWKSLWEELKSIVLFWIEKGITIFRVDNPHTKPFIFWQWLISEIKDQYPEVLFLSEAFTRPKVMYRLAKIGFDQSYTYFTWRNSKWELEQYLTELTTSEAQYYFRPNFWPNTPDILPEFLQYGGRPSYIIRLILAATLSSNYGIYGPAFELCVSDPLPGKEEYLNSEKYEIKNWPWDQPGNLKDLIARINRIRRTNPALQSTNNLVFYETTNDYILFYGKAAQDSENLLLVAVNLDPFHKQSGKIRIPADEMGILPGQPYLLHDLIGEERHVWMGEWNTVELDPFIMPARIFQVRRKLHREKDFDYFM